ncbi:MAG: hypothetical protein JWO19_2668 [Bryobacterales bacterium]|nr:hypothetical protein [Bryobacterales bacterium]
MRSLAISVSILLTSLLGQQATSPPKPAPDPGAFELGETQGTGRTKQGPRPVGGPAPHFADGRPDFGGNGAWYPGFGGNIAEAQWKGAKSADKQVDVPFLPAALELFNQRVTSQSKDDPEAQCLPVGVPRYMFDPYAFEIVQTPKQVMFLFEGDNYLWRTVPLRANMEHPKDVKPTWMGDAVGRYDKDTLVVDVVGFNGKAWLDQAGHPQTAQSHLTERYTRTDSLTLKYEVTIDDPGAYSKPWTTSNTVYWRPGFQLMEFICQENEKDSAHMLNHQ